MIRLVLGDCLVHLQDIPDASVDMVLADPPYGMTDCKWDSVIPLPEMWAQLRRVIKPRGAIAMTASQPFTSTLVTSNVKEFRHEWIWRKNQGGNFAMVKYAPFKEHESVLVFSSKRPIYYPIKEERNPEGKSRAKYITAASNPSRETAYHIRAESRGVRDPLRYPSSVRKINVERGFHPTQKPVALMEYLIKTYTLEGETVLDFAMGSGTTGVAARKLDRDFIGIELLEGHYLTAVRRIYAPEMGEKLI